MDKKVEELKLQHKYEYRKLSPYVPRWNVSGQINDSYKPRSVAYTDYD